MTTILIATLSVWVGYYFGRWHVDLLQNRGEAAVRQLLSERFPSPGCHLLNNVTLAFGDGTTQIDHVLVARNGVFVIEAKHYRGWIFANAAAPNWTQVIYRHKSHFQNPLFQNRKHAKAVERLLDFLPAEHIHSVVVFTGEAVFKTARPPGVVTLDELARFIQGFQGEAMSENRLQFCVGRLECTRKALTRQTDVEHVAYLKRKFGEKP